MGGEAHAKIGTDHAGTQLVLEDSWLTYILLMLVGHLLKTAHLIQCFDNFILLRPRSRRDFRSPPTCGYLGCGTYFVHICSSTTRHIPYEVIHGLHSTFSPPLPILHRLYIVIPTCMYFCKHRQSASERVHIDLSVAYPAKTTATPTTAVPPGERHGEDQWAYTLLVVGDIWYIIQTTRVIISGERGLYWSALFQPIRTLLSASAKWLLNRHLPNS